MGRGRRRRRRRRNSRRVLASALVNISQSGQIHYRAPTYRGYFVSVAGPYTTYRPALRQLSLAATLPVARNAALRAPREELRASA